MIRWVLVFLALVVGGVEAHANINRHEMLVVRGDRLFINVAINGVMTEALLDSGAEMTLVDDDFAREIALKPEGSEIVKGSGGDDKVRFAKGVKIRAINTDLTDKTVAILDLDELSNRLVGSKVRMILGREFFDAGRFELDIEAHKIRKLNTKTRPSGVMLPLSTHRGIEGFPVAIEGNKGIQAALDLGNGSEMMVGRTAAERLGLLKPERAIAQKKGGGIGGSVERDIVLLSTVTIAGKTFRNVRAAIDNQDSASDVNIGANLLRHFILVVDFPGHKLWLKSR